MTVGRLRWVPAVVVAVLAGLLALVLAVLARRQAPFSDEGIYAAWTERVASDPGSRFAPLTGGKEPLLEWLAAVLSLLGLAPFTAGRAVSIVASVVTLVLAAELGRQLGGRLVAVLAALLVATCPFLIVYGSLGVYEALATCLVLAALILQALLARTLRIDVALGLGIVLGLAFLTKGTSAILLVLWPLSLVCLDWSSSVPRRLARFLALSLLALVVAVPIRAILRLSDWYDDFLRERERQYPIHSVSEALSNPLRWVGRNGGSFWEVLVGYVSLPVLVAATIGVVVGARRRSPLTILVGAWVIIPWWAAVLLADGPYPRYVHLVVPPLLVLAAAGLAALIDLARRTVGGGVWPAVAVVALVAVVPVVRTGAILVAPGTAHYPGLDDEQLVTGWPAGTGWEETRRQLLARAGPGEHVVMRGSRFNQWLELSLLDDDRFRFVADDDEDAARALFALGNGEPPISRPEGLAWQIVHEAERPRGGTPVTLYESGALVDGAFLADPETLREALGGDDADYDAFLAEHPAIREWADAEYLSRG